MKKNSLLFIFSGVVVGLLLVVLGIYIGSRHIYVPVISGDQRSNEIQKISETMRIIQDNYVDSVSTDTILNSIIPDIFTKLDPHSYYLSSQQNQEHEESMQGHFYGIGITFNNVLDTVIVISCIKDGPSDLAGIQAGDRILFADSLDLRGSGVNAESIRKCLRGLKGSMVNLRVYRPLTDRHLKFRIKRGRVYVSSIDSEFMLNDSLGYIKVNSFKSTTYPEFVEAAVRLVEAGAKAMVIDLRNNPGGVMQSALAMANEFMKKNELIVYTEGRKYHKEEFRANGSGKFKSLPVYVLLNQYSASSSELFAGALQDNDRGIIIGRRSFGKGLVQKPFEYRDGSSVIITIARYHTPSGRCIQKQYQPGHNNDYLGEFFERSQSGEWYVKDSIHPDLKQIFKTISGRPVYGGGGIIPDVFIPIDTVGVTSYFREVSSKNLFTRFAFEYVDKNRKELAKYSGIEDALPYLESRPILEDFIPYARRYGVRPRTFFINKSKKLIYEQLYAYILSYAYGEQESRKLLVRADTDVQEAVNLFAQDITDPLILFQSEEEQEQDDQLKQDASFERAAYITDL